MFKKVLQTVTYHTYLRTLRVPAMNKGTAVFSSGYWRKGMVIRTDSCPSRGTLYTVKDAITDYVFQINRFQIRKSIL